MDVLAEALRAVHLRSRIYGRLELKAPWGMRLLRSERPEAHRTEPLFYAVSRGNCLLEIDGKRIPLAGGDFVFILDGTSHVLKDAPKSKVATVAEVYAQRGGRCGGIVQYGGDGAETTIISGSFLFEGILLSPIVESLPRFLHVKGDGGVASRWLESTMQFVASEMESELPGYETVASRLADVLFVQALRTHVQSLPEGRGGWLRALFDPKLSVVLQRLHEKPDEPWSVESLARVAGMSRSVFASRFKSVMGEAPLAYLTRWRMHRATQLIASGAASTSELAEAVGYETESAFVKAFKRHVGETPGAYRRRVASTERMVEGPSGPRSHG
ncbi:Transcriptional regulator, AraC family [Labilithrix luteola]|uniref:Transcriptional regulator, AraC family n=1 Tax=Labilithrix luteola TaxID=1391654 RepID=A0A0K1PVD8_9BACT|nr:AraC family transcriptional regulator [Labilithrix luteola]AKU97497.1 Transcriptional regulator, AraC family [Labilithrix luteola]